MQPHLRLRPSALVQGDGEKTTTDQRLVLMQRMNLSLLFSPPVSWSKPLRVRPELLLPLPEIRGPVTPSRFGFTTLEASVHLCVCVCVCGSC